MRVLVVLGSPRKYGNSETITQTIVEALAKVHLISVNYLRLSKLDISPCKGCGGCESTGMCVIQDEMIDLYKMVDEADVIFLTTPIYFYGPSAQIKTFIDRFQAYWSRKYLLKKRVRQGDKRAGYLISTAATEGKKLFDASLLIAKSFFDAIDVPYNDCFVVRGVDEKGAVNQKHEELEQTEKFAHHIIETLSMEPRSVKME